MLRRMDECNPFGGEISSEKKQPSFTIIRRWILNTHTHMCERRYTYGIRFRRALANILNCKGTWAGYDALIKYSRIFISKVVSLFVRDLILLSQFLEVPGNAYSRRMIVAEPSVV
ncbi:hypothetical protein MPTK1_6g15790 [Marchantia polymorpha subsp. ruderalis]|uniref:Uncharacterized protein n=2 Tax=Marchantia polymorpha TaxID=3197 RepID=A0AAF6BSH3_MARPO|nr:hypothetical protein MARPO_0056s0091 [Marchantia polymorpha]BBN14957.1 hypothetical protein Mp_6g15790 [Marchantia polymorpha subsp. ruderalis]|eukprot:PTQ37641.1 hypothetical protein MARPO_0056s0091 [Marchantia polymorpha]